MVELYQTGVGNTYLDFLNSYLEPRVGYVTVEGALSDLFEIDNSVFQGTVLGPPLWNTFFADVAVSATAQGDNEAMFADDLNVFREFDRLCPLQRVEQHLQQTRESVHKWGKRNRVIFDAGKEHIVVIHPDHGYGEPFKLLGCLIDVKLTMSCAVDAILSVARPKVTSLLRLRGHYSLSDLIIQYKTHIWSYIEYQNGCIYHAAPTHLDRFDRLQDHFLTELQSNASYAFVEHNFAPTTLRRDIGMLGLIHKRVIGLAHPAYETLMPLQPPEYYSTGRGTAHIRHNKQIYTHVDKCISQHVMFHRSIFGLCFVYNSLPQYIVDFDTVSSFQSELTKIAKCRCRNNISTWKLSFNATYHAHNAFVTV